MSKGFSLQAGELVLKEGGANLQRNVETVGGRLYLTNQRLVFDAHALNAQRGATELKLGDIQLVQPGWTKLLGILPLLPNAVSVFARGTGEHRFTVFGRAAWTAAIASATNATG